jgi:hypothetical protein
MGGTAMREVEQDRRRYPRTKRQVNDIIENAGPGVLNHVDNISASGVLCHTVRPVPVMTRMGMALNLPRPWSRRIECEGIVVRCEPDEVGDDHFRVAILYTRIGEADRHALNDFVMSVGPEEEGPEHSTS